VLRCGVVCCGVLQLSGHMRLSRAFGRAVVCCGVLQCGAVCCSVLRCVSVVWGYQVELSCWVCCSVLQCVAMKFGAMC